MSTFRRRLPKAFKVKGRSPEDYSQEFQEFVDQSVLIGEGRPAGFEEVDPTPIQAGTTADPGDPSDGWMAASAIIPVETAVPANATGSVASEGTGTALMRADATVKQGIVTTKGDLLSYSTVPVRVAVGTDGQVLTADSASTPGVKWADVTLGAGAFPLLAPNGSASAPSYSFSSFPKTGLWYEPTIGAPAGYLVLQATTASGTDVGGGNMSLNVGRGTGTGVSGIFAVSLGPRGTASGSTANQPQNILNFNDVDSVVGGIEAHSVGGLQVFAGYSRPAGDTDKGGNGVQILAGKSTGTGVGGNIALQVSPPAAATASTQNALQTIFLAEASTGDITLTGGLPGGAARGRVLIPSTTWLQQTASRKRLINTYTNATTTFSDTELNIDVVNGRRYVGRVVLFCGDSTAADGVKIDFNGGTATGSFIAAGNITDTVTAGINQEITTLAGVINQVTITGVTKIEIDFWFQASADGTFIVRAAQNAHTAGTLTIKIGSFMVVEDIN